MKSLTNVPASGLSASARGWLVGHRYVVDRNTARLVHQVRAQGGSHDYMGTKILDDHRLLRATTGSVLVPTEVPRTDP